MNDSPTHKQDQGNGVDPQEILRYTSGQMSDEEARLLEARSLEDPFLADALEGMEQTADTKRLEQFAYSLNQDLKRRLKKKRLKNKWIGFETPIWWPWTILILLLLITIAYLFIRKLGG
jgi:hypothetical protein